MIVCRKCNFGNLYLHICADGKAEKTLRSHVTKLDISADFAINCGIVTVTLQLYVLHQTIICQKLCSAEFASSATVALSDKNLVTHMRKIISELSLLSGGLTFLCSKKAWLPEGNYVGRNNAI